MTCKHGFEWCRGTGKQRGMRRPCYWCVADMEAELEQLRAIVGRLSTTADGVPVEQTSTGIMVWRPCGPEKRPQMVAYYQNGFAVFRGAIRKEFEPIPNCYSTREAAEKARKT